MVEIVPAAAMSPITAYRTMITTNPSVLYPWPISLPPLHEVVSLLTSNVRVPTSRPACGDYSQKGASIKRVKRPLCTILRLSGLKVLLDEARTKVNVELYQW